MTKDKRILASVAVAAVLLVVVPVVLFRSSKDERPAPRQETSHMDSGPVAPKNEPPASPQETLGANTRPVPPATAGGAESRRASLVIESPKQGATVGMREELTGRMEAEGWPVIFVQAELDGQPWWCQSPVASVDGGKFMTEVVFGDERTPSGMKFRIVGILTPTREEALKFNLGATVQTLPKGFPQSAVVVVTHR